MCNWIHQKDHHRHNHCPRHNTNPKECTCHCANTEIAFRYTLLSLRRINRSELNTILALACQKMDSKYIKREACSCSKVGYVNYTFQGKVLSSRWNIIWMPKQCQQNQPMESNLPGKKNCIYVSFHRRPEFGSYESRLPTGWLSWLSCAGGRGFKNPSRTNTQGF